jgi:Protein of unknown function (DUF2478)
MIGAVFYTRDEPLDLVLEKSAAFALAKGLRIRGFLQENCESSMCSRDIMTLKQLDTGRVINICLDLGENAARACRLNMAAMAEASALLQTSFETDFDLCILNKFGKAESEGEGFSAEIARLVELEKSLLIGVPFRFQTAFKTYAEGFYEELACDEKNICEWIKNRVNCC